MAKLPEPQRAAVGDGEIEMAITAIENEGENTRVSFTLVITKPITVSSSRAVPCIACSGDGYFKSALRGMPGVPCAHCDRRGYTIETTGLFSEKKVL